MSLAPRSCLYRPVATPRVKRLLRLTAVLKPFYSGNIHLEHNLTQFCKLILPQYVLLNSPRVYKCGSLIHSGESMAAQYDLSPIEI